MCAFSKFVGHIYALDGHGTVCVILAHQAFDEISTPHGVSIQPAATFFETEGQLKINWLNERQFEVDATGEILTRIPPQVQE